MKRKKTIENEMSELKEIEDDQRSDDSLCRPTGLIVAGEVMNRYKRSVTPKDKPTATVVTYEFIDGSGQTIYVDDYEPEEFLNVGDYVMLPVRIRPYVNRNTEKLSYSISVRKKFTKKQKGEAF